MSAFPTVLEPGAGVGRARRDAVCEVVTSRLSHYGASVWSSETAALPQVTINDYRSAPEGVASG